MRNNFAYHIFTGIGLDNIPFRCSHVAQSIRIFPHVQGRTCFFFLPSLREDYSWQKKKPLKKTRFSSARYTRLNMSRTHYSTIVDYVSITDTFACRHLVAHLVFGKVIRSQSLFTIPRILCFQTWTTKDVCRWNLHPLVHSILQGHKTQNPIQQKEKII